MDEGGEVKKLGVQWWVITVGWGVMVWCGVVRCGAVMVWCGVVWSKVEVCGVMCGVVWSDVCVARLVGNPVRLMRLLPGMQNEL